MDEEAVDRSKREEFLTLQALHELNPRAVQRTQQMVEFAGFLTRETDEALYVADAQGTWVIQREDILTLEDWGQAQCAPEFMTDSGRPVRVGIRDGATLQEIRPWLIRREPGGLGGREVRQAVEKIFVLGGSPLPIGERTELGESQLADLERMFSRRLGWDPDICHDPRANPRVDQRAAGSKTIKVNDGYTDVDDPF